MKGTTIDPTVDPRTAPDRLRAFLAEHDVIDPDAAYDEIVQDPRLLMDVLRCIGFVAQQYVQCNTCGAIGASPESIRHEMHSLQKSSARTFRTVWRSGEYR